MFEKQESSGGDQARRGCVPRLDEEEAVRDQIAPTVLVFRHVRREARASRRGCARGHRGARRSSRAPRPRPTARATKSCSSCRANPCPTTTISSIQSHGPRARRGSRRSPRTERASELNDQVHLAARSGACDERLGTCDDVAKRLDAAWDEEPGETPPEPRVALAVDVDQPAIEQPQSGSTDCDESLAPKRPSGASGQLRRSGIQEAIPTGRTGVGRAAPRTRRALRRGSPRLLCRRPHVPSASHSVQPLPRVLS